MRILSEISKKYGTNIDNEIKVAILKQVLFSEEAKSK
jgi:hypothetical protein